MSWITKGEADAMMLQLGIHPPSVGDIYWWQPMKEHAKAYLEVTAVIWNGEELWIKSRPVEGGDESLNEWGNWMKSTVLDIPASERTDLHAGQDNRQT